jgi:hypothetical protein
MSRRVLFAVAAGALAILFALVAAWSRPGPRSPRDAEVARLRAHFDTVMRELLAADVSHLTGEQRAARLRNVRELWLYRERGRFPQNAYHPGRRVPYFVGANGEMCAVGHLIARSGRIDIVERIARTRNNATIGELAGDPALLAWLDSNGLTLAEAARIQPQYGYYPPPPPPRPALDRRYAVASVIAGAFGGAAAVLNAPARRAPRSSVWREVIGLGAGGAGIALAATHWTDDSAPRALVVANGSIGLASATLALKRLIDRKERPASTRASVAVSPRGVMARVTW